MDKGFTLRLQSLSKQHQDNLTSLLNQHQLTQAEVTRRIMTGEKVPPDVLKEVFYLDATNRVINQLNFRSADKQDWTIRDYLEDLFENVMVWADTQPELLSQIVKYNHLDHFAKVEDNTLFPTLILTSLKRHEPTNQNPPTDPEVA